MNEWMKFFNFSDIDRHNSHPLNTLKKTQIIISQMEDTREGMKKDEGIKGLNQNDQIRVPLTFYAADRNKD